MDEYLKYLENLIDKEGLLDKYNMYILRNYHMIRLSNEDEEYLVKNAKENNYAKKILVKYYMPYIFRIANKYNTNYLDIEDLFYSGIEGLLKCINNYDSNKCTFRSYIYLYVKGYILKEIWQLDKVCKLNSHIIHLIPLYYKVIDKYNIEYKRNPTKEEIVKELKINEVTYYTLCIFCLSYISIDELTEEEIPVYMDNYLLEDFDILEYLSNYLTDKEIEFFKVYLSNISKEGINYHNICNILNISNGTIFYYINNIRNKIKSSKALKVVKDYCYEDYIG